MNKVVTGSISTAVIVYETIGVLGYFTFGATVAANVILMCKVLFIITGR